jgi:hypothetical protein
MSRKAWITAGLIVLAIATVIGYAVYQQRDTRKPPPNSRLTIVWENKQGYTGIDVQRKTGDGGTWQMVGKVPGSTTQFIDEGLSRRTRYCYQLIAYAQGQTYLSNAMCATAP